MLQDTFIDPDGTVYIYEISVFHRLVQSSSEHVTAEVLLLCYVARPIRGDNTSFYLSVISQVDTKSTVPVWVSSLFADKGRFGLVGGLDCQPAWLNSHGSGDSQGPRFSTSSSSSNSSSSTTDGADPVSSNQACASIKDFEVLSVIGRGGFGKVFQVRHKKTKEIYAMKVLSKADIKRRNQIERTRTERQVLATINHPFIIRLAYAFHSPQKVYMVMDFMHGGDFFTYMR